MQLVNDKVGMFDEMKNRRIGRDEVVERFGVGPEKVVEVQALAGDSVDNVPGVPGIGVKTAAQLINEYGDLDTLLERAGEIKQPKRRENLIEFADKARVSLELVTLKDDVPVDLPVDELDVPPHDLEKLVPWLATQGFDAIQAELRSTLGRSRRKLRRDLRRGLRYPARGQARPALRKTLAAIEAGGARPRAERSDGSRRRSPTNWSRTKRRSRPGSTGRASRVSSRSIRRRPRSTPCRRSWSACRFRCRPAAPATCRWRTRHRTAKARSTSAMAVKAGEEAPAQLSRQKALDLLAPLLDDPPF